MYVWVMLLLVWVGIGKGKVAWEPGGKRAWCWMVLRFEKDAVLGSCGMMRENLGRTREMAWHGKAWL